VIVVSSIRAKQLEVDNTLHHGPKLLREYLHYAQQVSRRYFEYKPKAVSMPAQVPLLKERLAAEVPQLQPVVPFADLTFVEDARYKGVVLTDDDLYYGQPSARHSHADVPQLLQLRYWPYQRVYSRQYWADREAVIEKLGSLRVRELGS
jgi:hypothetical protein